MFSQMLSYLVRHEVAILGVPATMLSPEHRRLLGAIGHFSYPCLPLQNRPVTAAFLRSLADKEKGKGPAANKMSAKAEKGSSQTDVRVGAP